MEASQAGETSLTWSLSDLETKPKADSDFSCLGEELERLFSAFARREEPSWDLSESMLTVGESEVSIANEHIETSRVLRKHGSVPFSNKPVFTRRKAQDTTWKRDLALALPEDCCLETIGQSPAAELVARYPKPSLGKWESGTKRGYEDDYYYCDL